MKSQGGHPRSFLPLPLLLFFVWKFNDQLQSRALLTRIGPDIMPYNAVSTSSQTQGRTHAKPYYLTRTHATSRDLARADKMPMASRILTTSGELTRTRACYDLLASRDDWPPGMSFSAYQVWIIANPLVHVRFFISKPSGLRRTPG